MSDPSLLSPWVRGCTKASARYRHHPDHELTISVVRLKLIGEAAESFSGDKSSRPCKLQPKRVDLLLLADHPCVATARAVHCGAPVVTVQVGELECAWVPMNRYDSFLDQFNAVLVGNGEEPVPTAPEEMEQLQERYLRQLQDRNAVKTRALQDNLKEARALVKERDQQVQFLMQQLATAKSSIKAWEAAAAAAAAAAAKPAAAGWESVTSIVLVMLHGTGLANPAVWQAWLQELPAGIRVVFHVCRNSVINVRSSRSSSSSSCREDLQWLPGLEVIEDRLMPERFTAEWGQTSMMTATIECMSTLLQRYPRTQHVMLASGTHLPLSLDPFAGCTPGTSWVPRMLATRSIVQDWAREGLQQLPELEQRQAAEFASNLLFHHQWCLVSAQHVSMLAAHLPLLQRTCGAIASQFRYHDRLGLYVRVAPDEYAIAMLLRSLQVPFDDERQQGLHGPEDLGRVLTHKFACSVFFSEDRVDHPVTFESRNGARQIFQDNRYQLTALSALMQAAKHHNIPFIRKVDIKVHAEAAALLRELQTNYWGCQQQQQQQATGGRAKMRQQH